jgi:uracil phosphoribosyltransferase
MCGSELNQKIIIIPILRAGLVMGDQLSTLIPTAKVGHIGIFRNPNTLEPTEYFFKLPPWDSETVFIIVDVMLATGGSAAKTLVKLHENKAKNLSLLCIVASPEGIKKINDLPFPVNIYVVAVDQKLNDHGYIVPGLGDAGDRIFGTK